MLYPLKFGGVYKDYLWGGRELENFGKKLPEGIVAESWEISSHPEGESVVSNGHYKGKGLTELCAELGTKLLGYGLSEKNISKFPLLIKLIDARNTLSVQVHPMDGYAHCEQSGECGKNEMWYIISAKPGAKIVYGLKNGVTKESFIEAIKNNEVQDSLNYLNVEAGDAVNIPAGLIHAIGEGVVIAEIQQNSNTTYRVYDYDRIDKDGNKRELHIDKALDVISFDNCNVKGKLKGLVVNIGENSQKQYLIANKYYSVEKYTINGSVTEETDGSRFFTLTCLEGEGMIKFADGNETICKGESVLIPALMGKYSIIGKMDIIKAYVPDLENDIIKPLIKEGCSREEIFEKVIS